MENQFLRSEMLWGPEAQARLAASHVILFGLGGVGSYTAECLARAGVGELTLVDQDTVSLTNLNRQLEALHSTLEQPKVQAVARRLLDINPALVLIPSTPPTTPPIGSSFSRRAAGMTTLQMPSTWSPASWIWPRPPAAWESPW